MRVGQREGLWAYQMGEACANLQRRSRRCGGWRHMWEPSVPEHMRSHGLDALIGEKRGHHPEQWGP